MTKYKSRLHKGMMDWLLFGAMAGLVLLGALCIMSAVNAVSFSNAVVRTHLIALPLGFVAFFAAWSFNYQIFDEQWKPLYGVILALLIGVLLFGTYQRGSKSWFVFPFFSMQPAEICRVLTILAAAAFLDRQGHRIRNMRTLVWLGVLIAPVFGLIMLQPDFSSIVITFPALLVLLYCAGVNVFYLALVFAFAAVAGFFTVAWTYLYLHPELLDYRLLDVFFKLSDHILYMGGFVLLVAVAGYAAWWLFKQLRVFLPSFYFVLATLVVLAGFFAGVFVDHQMKPYQRKRVEAFLAPESDPQGAPEKHTDFILAVVGEELGLWGTLLVLGLYLVILWRIAVVAYTASDRYGYLVCSGIFGMFLTYMLINFGMLIGLFPVAGIPLPFISYGGSNLVSSMLALGVVQSVYARRITSG